MNCSKCGAEGYCKEVGTNQTFLVCHPCSIVHRKMTEKLRLEYVEKLKEIEDFFFNSGKPKPVEEPNQEFVSTFVDNEELYEDVKIDDVKPGSSALFDEDSLPEMIFG